jgi:tRNA threonylcarbamoyladenosine biosynthesis protein TsaB
VNVLGLDTSMPSCAVGLLAGNGEVLEATDDVAAGQRPGHQARLLGLADGLLAHAGLGWESLDRIAVGLGPGTFTGLRIGVATARALAQSLCAELVGVSSSLALAHAALARLGLGAEGRVFTLVDARRGELFVAAYRADRNTTLPVVLSAPKPIPREEVTNALLEVARGAQAAGAGRWRAVGDGAKALRQTLTAVGFLVEPDQSPLHRVSGGVVSQLGSRMPAQAIETVLPEYCRRPDAELTLDAPKSGSRLASAPQRRASPRRAHPFAGRLPEAAAR